MRPLLALLLACAAGGCTNNFDPASYVSGLRLISVVAQPPEVAAGGSSMLTATTANPGGPDPTLTWDVCLLPPAPTSGAINPLCATNDMGAPFLPLGTGPTVSLTLPTTLTADELGLPDASDGVYVPVRVVLSAGAASLTGIYRLRFSSGDVPNPPNHNPTLMGVYTVPSADAGAEGQMTLAPDQPLEVHSGEQLHLRALLADGSSETYVNLLQGGAVKTETVSIAWYATAGSFSNDVTGEAKPDTTLTFDKHLPPSGSPVQLWIVAQDERGGADVTQRQLIFR